MGIRTILELPSKTEMSVVSPISVATNKIANAAVEILRLPSPGERVPGVKKGDRVEGRLVFQYVGPLSIRFEEDGIEKPKPKQLTAGDKGARKRGPKGNNRVGAKKRR